MPHRSVDCPPPHELANSVEQNYNSEFWELVEEHVLDYKAG